MPVAPITPDPGADGWGRRPSPTPPASGPPNADPDGHYRPAAVGTHRTALWFLLIGVTLVILIVPLAVPMNDADGTDGTGGTGTVEPYLLNEAGTDTLEGWEAAPLDLGGLDQRCYATGEAILPMTLEASCDGAYGIGGVDLDIAAMTGVGSAAGTTGTIDAARRALRAIHLDDMSDVPFHPTAADGVLHPTLVDRSTDLLTSPVIELSAPSSGGPDGFLDDLPDNPDYREPGMPADTRPVQYGGDTGGSYTVAASFLMDGEDSVLYTVAVTGDDPSLVELSANQLLGAIRAE